MKKKLATRILGGLALSSLVAIPSAYAQVKSDITATLKVYNWSTPSIKESTDKAIARFKKKYPNVTVEPIYPPAVNEGWGAYVEGFVKQASIGNTPDIFSVAIEGFSMSTKTGLLTDLEQIINNDADAQKVLSDIEPNLLSQMRSRPGGQLNFFPTEWNNIVVYYNKDIFDEAGIAYPSDDWTWEQFRETAKKLTIRKSDGTAERYGYTIPPYQFGLAPFLFSNKTSILDSNWEKSNVKDPAFRETLEFLNTIANVDKSTPVYDSAIMDIDLFKQGKTAMFSAGHWVVRSIQDSGMKNVGVAMMPTAKVQATVFGIGGMSILKTSKYPDLAWELIKEMTGSEYQKDLADSGASIPSSRTAATDPQWMAFPDNSQIFYGSAATALPIESPPNYNKVSEIFQRHVKAYLTQNQTIDETIDKMDSELSRAMKRANR